MAIDPTTGLAPTDTSSDPTTRGRTNPLGTPSLGTAVSTMPAPVAPPSIAPPSTAPPLTRTLPFSGSQTPSPTAPSQPSTSQPASSTGTLPPLPSQYALQLIKSGLSPSDVVSHVNAAYNLQTGSQGVYYPGTNTIGFNDGFYLAGPTFQNGMADWGSVQRGNESAPAASGASGDLTGMLTQLLSAFQAQPTNRIASMAPPSAPATAAPSSSTASAFPGLATNPVTGLPYGLSVNPVTGLLSTSVPPTGLSAPSVPGASTTQSTPGQGAVYNPATGTITGPVQNPGGAAPQPTAGQLAPGSTTGLPQGPPPPSSSGGALTTLPNGPGATIDPATGLPVPGSFTLGAPSGSAGPSTSSNPFSDPTQMALWEAVQAALSQSQTPPGSNPQTAALQAAITQLAAKLSGPAFSDAQLAQIRTASMDSIQADEDNAVQAEIQRQGLLGQAPTSGTVTDAVSKIKASYQTLKGQAQQASNMYELNTVTQRQQELLQALNLGATTATSNQQLGFQNAVTGAELSTLPVSAENTALNNALSVTAASNPTSLMSMILGLINSNQLGGQINAQNNSALATAIGKWLAGFATG